jgi:hypothetical protein
MSNDEYGDPIPPEPKKLPALVIPPIDGVLPFIGSHNPLTRSNVARRVSMTIPTPATNGIPRLFHFDGEREMAVALEALLSPDLYNLEVQLPKIRYDFPKGKHREKNWPGHHFDLRLTFVGGYRRGVYVKNGTILRRRKTQDEIAAIFEATPSTFADDLIVVNGDDYTQAYRDNLRRLWLKHQRPDQEVDAYVESIAREGNYWYISDLTKLCDIPHPDAFGAVLRLVARRTLGVDWYSVINAHSRVWLQA